MVIVFHGFGGYNWRDAYGDFWGGLASTLVGVGRFGVNVFFVLSGFLITGLLFKAHDRKDYYLNFYIRRVLRIVPVYVVVLVILKIWHVVDFRFVAAALLFLANFSRLFGAPLNEYGPVWSLAVEEHFYLFWPTCVRRFQEKVLLRLLLLVIVSEPLLRFAAIHISNHIDIHYKTPFVLDFLAYGALLSLLIRTHRIHLDNVVRIGSAILGVSAVLSFLVIWLSAFHMGPTIDALADLPFTWGACGVLLLGLKRDHVQLERTGRTDARGILPFYGYISYGLYLINVLVYNKTEGFLFRHIRHESLRSLAVFSAVVLTCIAISTVLAYLSRRYFEGPILSLKNKWQHRSTQPSGGTGASAANVNHQVEQRVLGNDGNDPGVDLEVRSGSLLDRKGIKEARILPSAALPREPDGQ
jgi:peptidoglycan/LPS O-acetylase OafA/YrhL